MLFEQNQCNPSNFQACLGWTLYNLGHEHIERPLVNFSMNLPASWGMPLGWSLAFIPVFFLVFGFLFHLIWQSRGMPFAMVRINHKYEAI